MSTSTTPTVGLIGLPNLGAFLSRIGVRAVAGEDYRQATAVMRAGMSRGEIMPIIMLGTETPGGTEWAERMARVSTVVVLCGPGGPAAPAGTVGVELPASLPDILTAVGVRTEGLDGHLVNVDGEVGVISAVAPTPPSEPAHAAPPTGYAPPDSQAPQPPPASSPAAQGTPSPPTEEDSSEPGDKRRSAFTAGRTPITRQPPEPPDSAPPATTETTPEREQQPTPEPEPLSAEPLQVPSAATPIAGVGDVVIAWSGRGGVGKSTWAIGLAHRAAEAGLRVILVDANVGQGDIRDFLRIGQARFPSVYQAAVSGNVRDALIDPESINRYRPNRLDKINFGVIQAPPDHLADDSVVTPHMYANIVEQARDMADLVVLDTQIVEARDATGMVDHLIAPLLRTGAWGLGITDLSSPGYSKLERRLRAFDKAGVSAGQMMTVLNKLPGDVSFNAKDTREGFNRYSIFLGTVSQETAIQVAMNHGQMVSAAPPLAPVLDAALHKMTGLEVFKAGAAAGPAATPGNGLLDRLRGWKRRA